MTKTKRIELQNSTIKSHTATGWIFGENKDAGVKVLHRTNSKGRFECKIILGTSAKIFKWYSFLTFEAMSEYVERVVSNGLSKLERRRKATEARKSLKASDFWMVGDVVYNSWGYDQTNVDFYQVVKVNAKTIVIREVTQNSSDIQGSPHGGKTQPRRHEFVSDAPELLKALNPKWPDSISFNCGAGRKWDGRPLHCSSYH